MADEGRDAITYERTADMRYVGQGHEVSVPLPDGPLGPENLPEIVERFEQVYRALYGRGGPDVPLEVVNWRLVASEPRPHLELRLPREDTARGPVIKGSREAYFPEHGDYAATPVYDRYALTPGTTFAGPAIVCLTTWRPVSCGRAAKVTDKGAVIPVSDSREDGAWS